MICCKFEEKVSTKILKHINDRFDKLEQTLQAVQNSQKELISSLKNENSVFKSKVDDLEGRSRQNSIQIKGIPELEESSGHTGPCNRYLQKEPNPAPSSRPLLKREGTHSATLEGTSWRLKSTR